MQKNVFTAKDGGYQDAFNRLLSSCQMFHKSGKLKGSINILPCNQALLSSEIKLFECEIAESNHIDHKFQQNNFFLNQDI